MPAVLRRRGLQLFGLAALLCAGLIACAGTATQKEIPVSDDGPKSKEKEKEPKPVKEEPTQPVETANTGRGVLLRLKHRPGQDALYEANFDRRQEGTMKFVEAGAFTLRFACLENASNGLDLLSIERVYTDRTRTEIYPNGKKQPILQPNIKEFLDFGPNMQYVAGARAYAFDSQGCMAYRKEDLVHLDDKTLVRGEITKQDPNFITVETVQGQKYIARARIAKIDSADIPHVLIYDTPHYYFPIFSSKPVSVGDTWAFRLPVILLTEHTEGVLPTHFQVRCVGKLRELQTSGDHQIATIEYTYTGDFDSGADAFKDRFSDEFREKNRVMHSIEGSGTLVLDNTRGLILEKTDTFKMKMIGESHAPKSLNKPAEENIAKLELTSLFKMKYLRDAKGSE